MLKHRRKLLAAAAAALAAGTIAVTGITAAIATPVTGPAISGTEHFQLMSTSATSSTSHAIAYGIFTAGGLDHQGAKIDTVVFPGGTIKFRHSPGTGPQTFNPKTCLLTISKQGTYKLLSGTGKYAGISGHGSYKLSILAIGARSGGNCTKTRPPVAFQLIIRASGPAHL
ncbi:MAG TPA: hypothetical protein VF834_00095 [Streptosporangiaceae bacterium]